MVSLFVSGLHFKTEYGQDQDVAGLGFHQSVFDGYGSKSSIVVWFIDSRLERNK